MERARWIRTLVWTLSKFLKRQLSDQSSYIAIDVEGWHKCNTKLKRIFCLFVCSLVCFLASFVYQCRCVSIPDWLSRHIIWSSDNIVWRRPVESTMTLYSPMHSIWTLHPGSIRYFPSFRFLAKSFHLTKALFETKMQTIHVRFFHAKDPDSVDPDDSIERRPTQGRKSTGEILGAVSQVVAMTGSYIVTRQFPDSFSRLRWYV